MCSVQIRTSDSYMKGMKILLRSVILTRELAYPLLYGSRKIKRIPEIMAKVS